MSYHALHCVETIWVLSGLTIQMQYTICALPCPFNQVSLMSPSIVCTPPIGQKMSYNKIQNDMSRYLTNERLMHGLMMHGLKMK